MAAQGETRAEADDPGPWLGEWAFALGRTIGFTLLASMALAILAAVVLLPEYLRWSQDRYERDFQAAVTADLQSLVNAQERMFSALKDDPVLNERLAMSNLDYVPTNETVLPVPSAPPGAPPGVINQTVHPRPEKPDNVFLRTALRLEDAPTRRGLLLVAAALMLVAMFLFAPPQKYKNSRPKTEG